MSVSTLANNGYTTIFLPGNDGVDVFCANDVVITLTAPPVLEENARSNPEARIHPLAHVSVDRAYQAESVGRNSLLSTLFYYSLLSNL